MKWFKHDTAAAANNKLRRLVLRHGPVGYAVYFHCLELVAGAIDAHNITFEMKHDSEVIADNLKVVGDGTRSGCEIVEAAMRTIVELGLFEESEGRIFCMKLAERLDNSTVKNPELARVQAVMKERNRRALPGPVPSRMIPDDPGQIRSDEKREEEEKAPEPLARPGRKPVPSKLTDSERARVKAFCDFWADEWREAKGVAYAWGAWPKVERAVHKLLGEAVARAVDFHRLEAAAKWWIRDAFDGYDKKVEAFAAKVWTLDGALKAMKVEKNGGIGWDEVVTR
jgi:hypothetical protein